MTKDFANLIADESYRKGFFDRLELTIGVLRANGHFEAVKGYCSARAKIEAELKMYGVDAPNN